MSNQKIEQQPGAPETEVPGRFVPTRGTLATLLLVSMLNCMGGAAVAPALPAISAAFPGSTETMVAFIVSLPALAVAISGLFVGALADRIGKAKTLVASLVLFSASGLSGILAPSLELLLATRFIMGIGIAGVSTASTALIADYYDAHEQARVLGLQSAAGGASILMLETLGGFMALAGWRAPFLVYAIGIPMIAMSLAFVREPYRSANGRHGAVREARSKAAPLTKAAAGVVALCLVFVFVDQTVSFLGPSKMPFLVASFGGSTVASGLFLGASGLANILSSLAYAPLFRRFGRFAVGCGGFAVTAAGCLVTAFAQSQWYLLAGIVLVNAAVGVILPLGTNWLATVATPQTSGKLMGANAMLLNLGQFFCPLWSGLVLTLTDSYSIIYIVAALIACAMIVVCVVAFKVVRIEHR